MRKLLVIMALFIPLSTNAATVSWEKVTTYDNETLIPSSRLSTIIYKAWYGPDKENLGAGASVVDADSATAPDPPEGATWWYSVTAALPGGPESAKATPASKTVAVPTPSAPAGCSVR